MNESAPDAEAEINAGLAEMIAGFRRAYPLAVRLGLLTQEEVDERMACLDKSFATACPDAARTSMTGLARAKVIAALLLGSSALLPAGAWAQSAPVYQTGALRAGGAGDLAKFWRNGQIGDVGGVLGDSQGNGVNPFAVTDRNGLGQCFNTANTGQAYNAFCIGHDADGNPLLTIDSYGVASKSLRVRQNSIVYPFPGSGNGNVVGPNSSTDGNLVLFNGTGGSLLKDGGHPVKIFNIRDYGAACDGTTDDHTADQAAVTAAGLAGGGVVYIDCQTKIATGSLTIDNDNVTISGISPGVSKILCRNGTSDCVKSDGIVVRARPKLRDLTIDGTGQTGGNCLALNGVSDAIVDHVVMTACWDGLLVAIANNVTVQNHTTIAARDSSGYAIKYYTNPGTGNRSDVLNLLDGTINNSFSGADGIVWDGAAYTLRIANFNVIAVKHGLYALNTTGCTGTPSGSCAAGSGAGYPQFADIVHLEVDGASASACDLETGFDFMIANSICSNQYGASGQGSADTAAMVINPDTSGGITRNIRISNSHIGNAKQQALLLNGCQNCYSSNVVYDDASHAGSGSYPAVEVGANAANVSFVGGQMGPTFGNSALSSYGLKVDAGSAGITASCVNYNNNVTGSYLDSTGAAAIGCGVGYTGNQISPTLAYAHGPKPTASSCGTGPSTAGSAAAGSVMTGSGSVSSCTLTFQSTAQFCTATPSGSGFTTWVSSVTGNTVVLSFSTSIPSTAVYFTCPTM